MKKSHIWPTVLISDKISIKPTIFGKSLVDENWKFIDRTHEDHMLYFILERGCKLKIHEETCDLQQGDLFWLNPLVRHSLWIDEGAKGMNVIHIRFQVILEDESMSCPFDYRIKSNTWKNQHLMEQLLHDLMIERPHQQERLKSFLCLIYSSLVEDEAQGYKSGNSLGISEKQKLIQLVQIDRRNWVSPEEMAKHLKLSHDYFTRIFKKSFGMPPRTWLVNERIQSAAMTLLESSLPVNQIADQYGYKDTFLFSRQFKQVMGQSPLNYRKSTLN